MKKVISIFALFLVVSGSVWAQSNRIKFGGEMPRQKLWRSELRWLMAYEREILPKFACEVGFSLGMIRYEYPPLRQFDLGFRINPRYYFWQEKESCTGLFIGPVLALDQFRTNNYADKKRLTNLNYMATGLMTGLQVQVYKRFSIQNQIMFTKRFYSHRRSFNNGTDQWPPSLNGIKFAAFVTVGYSIGKK
jgi:hypothetical protein